MRVWQLGVLTILACSTSGLRAQDGDIEWLPNYREALQVAKATKKPLLVEFRCEA
jgi:hypothetical protein